MNTATANASQDPVSSLDPARIAALMAKSGACLFPKGPLWNLGAQPC